MSTRLRTSYAAVVAVISLVALTVYSRQQAPAPEDVPVKDAGGYKVGDDPWRILIIPPGVSRERLIHLAIVLHEADPSTRYQFFDDDGEVVKFLMSMKGISDFPQKWFSKHNAGSLQTMPDDGGTRWMLLGHYADKIADLGPGTTYAPPAAPPAARAESPKPAETPAFFDPAGEVKVEYDRFEAKTKVSLNNALVTGKHLDGLYLMAYAERPNGALQPSLVVLGFKAITPFAGAYFPEEPRLDALIDGAPVPFGSMTRLQNQDVIGILNVEMYGVAITPAMLARLARAKAVEMRLNKTEFKLSARHQELLLKFEEDIG